MQGRLTVQTQITLPPGVGIISTFFLCPGSKLAVRARLTPVLQPQARCIISSHIVHIVWTPDTEKHLIRQYLVGVVGTVESSDTHNCLKRVERGGQDIPL